jgi:spore germination cell wall hydrolase CwlJ-like protein
MVKIILAVAVVSALFFPRQANTDILDIPENLYSEYRCMKLALHYEARGEGIRGMQAIANVIMNRVNSKRFPDSVCDVVYQKHKSSCQFSWYCDPRLTSREPKIGFKAKLLAYEAVVNSSLKDITHGAMWFHSGEDPSWASEKRLVAVIGNHKFYR